MNVLECGRSLVINIDLMKDLERLQLENNLNCNSFRSRLVCFLCDEITREKLIDVNERLVLMIRELSKISLQLFIFVRFPSLFGLELHYAH